MGWNMVQAGGAIIGFVVGCLLGFPLWLARDERIHCVTVTTGGAHTAGYYRDAPGQDYAMARYYSASSGSFWSPDPGGPTPADPTNPIRWNRYLYVSGDPINRIDPLGREDCDPDEDDPCFETEVDATADDGGGDDDGGGGDGDGVDSSPQQPQKPSKPNKPQKPCANTSAVNFISAHLADASTLGTITKRSGSARVGRFRSRKHVRQLTGRAKRTEFLRVSRWQFPLHWNLHYQAGALRYQVTLECKIRIWHRA